MMICKSVSVNFGNRAVLRYVTFSANPGQCFGVFGANGSGKSTLLKVLGGLITPSQGSVELTVNSIDIPASDRPFKCGLVAPYLRIYNEFTPLELLEQQCRFHDQKYNRQGALQHLERLNLADRSSDVVSTFSSGMLQRVVLALATHLQPPVLLLDEPSVTMDAAGRKSVEDEINLQMNRGGLVLLATNDEREKSLCTDSYSL